MSVVAAVVWRNGGWDERALVCGSIPAGTDAARGGLASCLAAEVMNSSGSCVARESAGSSLSVSLMIVPCPNLHLHGGAAQWAWAC